MLDTALKLACLLVKNVLFDLYQAQEVPVCA
jgi:hypothetical protein